jgi:membrane protease subunit HflK
MKKSIRFGNTIIEVPNFIPSSGKIVLPIVIVLWLLSGLFIVGPDENGVIRQFGELSRVVGPGINYALPWPIESVDKPKVTETKRIEVGFRTDPRNPTRFIPVKEEASMLTGDENIVEADLIVQYNIKDAAKYLFKVSNVENAVKMASEAVLREVIGRRKIDEALTTGKNVIQTEIQDELQLLMDKYESGVYIINVQLQDVDPPEAVAGAFKDVASAKEDKNRLINEAQSYKNKVIPKANGDARKMVLEAEAYAQARIERAKGDAERFKSDAARVPQGQKRHQKTPVY